MEADGVVEQARRVINVVALKERAVKAEREARAWKAQAEGLRKQLEALEKEHGV